MVIGPSIAGLVIARALASHDDEVVEDGRGPVDVHYPVAVWSCGSRAAGHLTQLAGSAVALPIGDVVRVIRDSEPGARATSDRFPAIGPVVDGAWTLAAG